MKFQDRTESSQWWPHERQVLRLRTDGSKFTLCTSGILLQTHSILVSAITDLFCYDETLWTIMSCIVLWMYSEIEYLWKELKCGRKPIYFHLNKQTNHEAVPHPKISWGHYFVKVQVSLLGYRMESISFSKTRKKMKLLWMGMYVSMISFYGCMLMVYKKAITLCKLILKSVTLLNLFIISTCFLVEFLESLITISCHL